MKARRLMLTGVVALATLTAGTGAAHAAPGLIGDFGNTGPNALVGYVGGVAVDNESNDVYVANIGGYRVMKYTPAGELIYTIGREVNETAVEAGGSEAEQDICTTASGDTCQAGKAGSGPGQFGEPSAVAVDSASGDFYVADPENDDVQKFDAEGEYLSQIDSGAGGAPTFTLPGYSNDVAVDGSGNLYVLQTTGFFGTSEVLKFDSAGAYTGVKYGPETLPGSADLIGGAKAVAVSSSGEVYVGQGFFKSYPYIQYPPGGGFATAALDATGAPEREVAVAPLLGDVFVENVPSEHDYEVFEYSPADKLLESFVVQPVEAGGYLNARGYAYDLEEGRLYISDAASGSVMVIGPFPTPSPEAPAVQSESVADVTETTASLAGVVAPNQFDTTYYFQYATEESFADAVDAPATPADIGSGVLPVAVSQQLAGLRPSTLYYFRIVAHNSYGGGAGSTVDGATRSFTTHPPAPAVATEGVSALAATSATLEGSVTPGSTGVASDTKWCFEYGSIADAGYDQGFAPGTPIGDAGQGESAVPVSVPLAGLEPGTTYRYRLVAINGLGLGLGSTACGTAGGQEAEGAVRTFTTPPLTLAAPLARTGTASGVSENEATISGAIDSGGLATSYAFQVGIDTSYGAELFGQVQAGAGAGQVSVTLRGLQPGTTYHYRLVARSAGGASYGADGTFTTGAYPSSLLAAPSSPALVATPPFAFPGAGKAAGRTNARKRSRAKARRRKKHRHGRARKRQGGGKAGRHAGAAGESHSGGAR